MRLTPRIVTPTRTIDIPHALTCAEMEAGIAAALTQVDGEAWAIEVMDGPRLLTRWRSNG